MSCPTRLLLLLLLSVACALCAGPEPLFNGRDLSGWVHEGPRATFGVSDGLLTTSGAGSEPNWLHTAVEYENVHLTFEYRLAQWAEAAVILRAPRLGRPMQAGIAIFLAHDFHENVTPYITGAVAGVLPPSTRLPTSFDKWHSADITLNGDHLRASIDGITVQDVQLNTHPELRYRLRRGFIGFPDLGHRYALRNIMVEDLGNREKYVDLFDGNGITAWKLRGEGSWTARDGVITGSNGHGILYAAPVFRDFELTLLVRSHNRVNGGIFLRGSPELKEYRGFEVQIYSPLDSVYPTGSVYGKQRARLSADLEDRWFLMQIRVEGRRCFVRLDGEAVADYGALAGRDLEPGRIGLQIHLENASVEFRDVRVRPL